MTPSRSRRWLRSRKALALAVLISWALVLVFFAGPVRWSFSQAYVHWIEGTEEALPAPTSMLGLPILGLDSPHPAAAAVGISFWLLLWGGAATLFFLVWRAKSREDLIDTLLLGGSSYAGIVILLLVASAVSLWLPFSLLSADLGPGRAVDRDVQPDLPPGEQGEGFFEVSVFFATDRERLETGKSVQFTGRRGSEEELSYGRVRVSLPDARGVGEIPSPQWYHFRNREDPTRFVVITDTGLFEDRSLFSQAIGRILSEAGRDDVLLFLHGYNTTFEDAAKRTAQLAYDLKFTGAPLFYTWPSMGQVDEYATDEESVKWSRPHFDRFLRFTLTDLGARNVHVIAHSMGNRILAAALEELDLDDLPEGSARLRQVVLAAPDIDIDVFKQLARNFPGKADRITLYVSQRDKALGLSEKVHEYPRAGNSVVVVDGVDTVDATAAETDFLAHTYFGNSILPDIFDLIWSNQAPDTRFGLIRRRTADGASYWKLLPRYAP